MARYVTIPLKVLTSIIVEMYVPYYFLPQYDKLLFVFRKIYCGRRQEAVHYKQKSNCGGGSK
jgi:hypothetical protein